MSAFSTGAVFSKQQIHVCVSLQSNFELKTSTPWGKIGVEYVENRSEVVPTEPKAPLSSEFCIKLEPWVPD